MHLFTHRHTPRVLILLMLLSLCFLALPAMAEVVITIKDSGTADEAAASTQAPEADPSQETAANTPSAAPAGDASAREAFIDGILALAKDKFDAANGRAQRAHYSGDIYVCKNYTVYLFKQNAGKFRMAEYPDVPLIIPDNRPRKECVEVAYGAEWKDIPASDGNPFYAAASFRYDPDQTKEENHEIAREFLKQVKRGDYFQMSAKYYYGVGAHSMIYIADYDPETDSVHWCDSNMSGKTVKGERYGYVQYDAVKEIDWFVDAFCRKKSGATLYRLRDDIVYANEP
ncbi:MAG: hypothetical protein RR085_09025 [Clostridia bacterium]